MNDVRPRPVVWTARFELPGAVHCWYHKDDQQWHVGISEDICAKWREHRGRRGKTGFLRFIHALPDQLQNTNLLNPFTDDTKHLLWICHEGQVTELGDLVYCEVYLCHDERGVHPVYKVFLNRNDKIATIECYDAAYTEVSRMAYAAVEQSYIDEEEAA